VGPPIAASIPAGSQSVAIMIQRNGLKKWLHGNLSKNATVDISKHFAENLNAENFSNHSRVETHHH
jgi:hypothetical protein